MLEAHARESFDAFPECCILQDVAARVLHACKRSACVSLHTGGSARHAGPCESNTLHAMLLKPHCGAVGVPFMYTRMGCFAMSAAMKSCTELSPGCLDT